MKITKVETFLLEKRLSSPMRISRGGFSIRHHAIVRVHTDTGLTGLGEGVGNALFIVGILEAQMAQMAVGLDPLEIDKVRSRLIDGEVYFERKGSALCAASAIEMACWDIKGKALKAPVHELLGGLRRSKIKAYASDIYWEKSADAMAERASRIVGSGFRAVKAHVGCEPVQAESQRIKALRKAVGKDTALMIDLNAGYDAEEASQAAQEWKEHGIQWLEEPLHPEAIHELAELRLNGGVRIAAGENEFQVHGFRQLFEAKAIDVAMPDIGRVGGLQETRDICAMAETHGVQVSPHNFSSGVLLAATMHLMASTPNTEWLEWDSSQNAVYEELLAEPLEIEGGSVSVPQGPGLGVCLSDETISKYGVRKTVAQGRKQ